MVIMPWMPAERKNQSNSSGNGLETDKKGPPSAVVVRVPIVQVNKRLSAVVVLQVKLDRLPAWCGRSTDVTGDVAVVVAGFEPLGCLDVHGQFLV